MWIQILVALAVLVGLGLLAVGVVWLMDKYGSLILIGAILTVVLAAYGLMAWWVAGALIRTCG